MSNAEAAVAAAPSEPEWAALAAIDWADQKNFWRLLPAGSRQSEAGELDNTPEAVEVWAANLQERFGGRPIAVILEQTRGALVYMLTKYPHLVLFPVHPTTAARYRETFAPSGAKSDPSDTDSLLDLLLRHRERLRPLRPDTVETRLLHFLVEERRQTVDERTRASHRLTDCLKLYFPQVLDWFDDVTSPLVGDLLERWPTLEQLQRAHPGTLRRFFTSTTRGSLWPSAGGLPIRRRFPICPTIGCAGLRIGAATVRERSCGFGSGRYAPRSTRTFRGRRRREAWRTNKGRRRRAAWRRGVRWAAGKTERDRWSRR